MKNNLFGFGCMRLPLFDSNDKTSFDYPLIEEMFDEYLSRGYTYFDTAYTYHGYRGEECVRKALVERYPRNAFEIASKLPLRDFKDHEDMYAIFDEQLHNLGISYFDYYLLHNMGHNVYQKCVDCKAFEFVAEMKRKKKARHVGMSFHDTPELLEEILLKYGSYLDFVQLQINYVDFDNEAIQSRKCLEVCKKHLKPVTVMEPCKGGTLINLPEKAMELLGQYGSSKTPASLALRFALSQSGVARVLSGMNAMEQVKENLDIIDGYEPLDSDEYKLIDELKKIINENTAVPCTACGYCQNVCPQGIAIPTFFSLYNSVKSLGMSSQNVYYINTVEAGSPRANACLECGACEEACPQHIDIRDNLKKVSETFDGFSYAKRGQ